MSASSRVTHTMTTEQAHRVDAAAEGLNKALKHLIALRGQGIGCQSARYFLTSRQWRAHQIAAHELLHRLLVVRCRWT